MPKGRDYKQERKTAIARGEHGNGTKSKPTKNALVKRATRKAKKEGKLKAGEEAHHKKPISKGGSNSSSNVEGKSASANKAHGGRIGNKEGKRRGGRKGGKAKKK